MPSVGASRRLEEPGSLLEPALVTSPLDPVPQVVAFGEALGQRMQAGDLANSLSIDHFASARRDRGIDPLPALASQHLAIATGGAAADVITQVRFACPFVEVSRQERAGQGTVITHGIVQHQVERIERSVIEARVLTDRC